MGTHVFSMATVMFGSRVSLEVGVQACGTRVLVLKRKHEAAAWRSCSTLWAGCEGLHCEKMASGCRYIAQHRGRCRSIDNLRGVKGKSAVHSANSKLLVNMSEDESQLENHHLYYSQIKRLTHRMLRFPAAYTTESSGLSSVRTYSVTPPRWSSHLGRHG